MFLFLGSNDEIEEGDPGSDSDFEINARREVSHEGYNTFYYISVFYKVKKWWFAHTEMSKYVAKMYTHL